MRPIQAQTVQQIVDRILELGEGSRAAILAPVARARKSELKLEIEKLRREGFVRARIDGKSVDLGDEIVLDGKKPHDLDVVIDRIVLKEGVKGRVTDSVELALKLGDGRLLLDPSGVGEGEPIAMSERFACIDCGISLPPIEPRMFSFNGPHGACKVCDGIGSRTRVDPERIVPDPKKTLREGAVLAWGRRGSVALRARGRPRRESRLAACRSTSRGRSSRTTRKRRSSSVSARAKAARAITRRSDGAANTRASLRGSSERSKPAMRSPRGTTKTTRTTASRTTSGVTWSRACATSAMASACVPRRSPCSSRARTSPTSGVYLLRELRRAPRASRRRGAPAFRGRRIATRCFGARARAIAAPLLRAVIARLGFLIDVGLDYLTLDRSAMTLSGGEGQRIRLATQIGAALVGVLYVLDEPSVGLHARDNSSLIEALRALVDLGNSVIVVEHDRETILRADHVIDMGPGAGEHGGTIVAEGTAASLIDNEKSVTGPYLAHKKRLYTGGVKRRKPKGFIEIKNARANNLRGIDVKIPVGVITAVTGVSGSGKSSLITDTLLPAARRELYRSSGEIGASDGIVGLDQFDKVISIDQGMIGRTPRSNPATYSGVFSLLRDLFASLPEARARGYKAGRVSLNVKGGRCEACQGDGVLRVEMHFLPDIFVECETCGGKRYNRETLEVLYRGRSVADVLDLTVDEALVELEAVPRVRELLAALTKVGLGYVRLGQPATTLSGGEAQRVKLARELARRATGRTLYVFDEPTTGLHFQDIELFLVALAGLADAGNTVIVIEHNLELVANADYVLDLGPEGGERGGQLVATGTPEQVAAAASHTGHYLADVLRSGEAPRTAPPSKPSEPLQKSAKRASTRRA